jgi:hypothetical protein
MTTLEKHINHTKELLEQCQIQIALKEKSLKELKKMEAELIKDQIDLLEELNYRNKSKI